MAATIACGASGTIALTNLVKVDMYTVSRKVVFTYANGSTVILTATADVNDAIAGITLINQLPVSSFAL